MLELTMTAAGPGLLHRAIPPMGYLDHWALRLFAGDATLAERLVAALNRSGGTLTVSWLNFGEYASVTDREQRLQAERLLDRILPSIFCIDVEPFAVSKREQGGAVRPHADEALALQFINNREPAVKPFTASGLFESLNHPRLIASKEALAHMTQGRLEKLRQEHTDDPSFRRAVARAGRTPNTKLATSTIAIMRALTATFFPDLGRAITPNDAIDLLHAVVPLAFCDAVLLDGATWDAVERARLRLPGVNMAAAFSGRVDGVDRFIAQLGRPAS